MNPPDRPKGEYRSAQHEGFLMNPDRGAVEEPSALTRLFDELAAAPYAHDFFHTLRRIETMTPRSPRLGRALRPGLEPVRLGQDPELDFAPASLVSFAAQAHAPPRLGVRFLGLFGPQGPLPLHLTEYARERERHHADPGLARFADLFHHRVLTLFYRAWAQAQPAVHADRPEDDQFAKWLGALFGVAPAEFRDRDSVPDAAKRFHAGTLSRGVKNAEGLETLLRQHLRVPVRVQSFVGHWMRLRPQDQTRLGAGHAAEPSAQLGASAVAGSKVWDRQYKFRLCVGPLDWSQYESLLPGGSALPVLRDWVRQFAGLDRLWDVQLTLAACDVPRARLAPHPAHGDAPATRLGLSTWLGGARRRSHSRSGNHSHDRDDLVLRPESLALATF
jgi:type VI secretion system protein ImpH